MGQDQTQLLFGKHWNLLKSVLLWSPARVDRAMRQIALTVPGVNIAELLSCAPPLLVRFEILPAKLRALRWVLAMPEDVQAKFIVAMAKPRTAARVLSCSTQYAHSPTDVSMRAPVRIAAGWYA
jgi:hypothetical protein